MKRFVLYALLIGGILAPSFMGADGGSAMGADNGSELAATIDGLLKTRAAKKFKEEHPALAYEVMHNFYQEAKAINAVLAANLLNHPDIQAYYIGAKTAAAHITRL